MHGMHHRTWAPVDDINYRGRGWLSENYEGYYQSAIGWNMCITAAGLSPHFVMGYKLKPYEEIALQMLYGGNSSFLSIFKLAKN